MSNHFVCPQRSDIICAFADLLTERKDEILSANKKDMEHAANTGNRNRLLLSRPCAMSFPPNWSCISVSFYLRCYRSSVSSLAEATQFVIIKAEQSVHRSASDRSVLSGQRWQSSAKDPCGKQPGAGADHCPHRSTAGHL